MDYSKLYYEAHVTIEPVFEEKLFLVKHIAGKYGYRVADLLMQKREKDSPERSKFDTFMTTRHVCLQTISERTKFVVQELQEAGIAVWRYKIEDTVLDSKIKDEYNLIEK